jgi:4-amino-4-deoxy-L-arabinose transferase-like glycosyltransferase
VNWRNKLHLFLLENKLASLMISAGAILKIVLVSSSNSTSIFLEPDSFKYLKVAENYSSYLDLGKKQGNWDFFLISPGYPLFLKFFGDSNIKLILICQILLLAFTQIGVYLISKNLLGKQIALITLTLFVLESSSNLSSIVLLSETLFSALFTFVVIKTLRKKSFQMSRHQAVMLGILLGISILIRPIGQVLLLAFLVLLANMKARKLILTILLSSICVTSLWSFHNKISYGSLQLSGIQSFNLLYFEGVGAKSTALNRSLSVLQSEEIEREKISYPSLNPINKVVNYRIERAKALILDYKSGFIEMHLRNIPKMMLAPGNASISRISKEFGFSQSLEIVVKTLGILVAGFLLILAGIGFISILFRRNRETRIEVLFLTAIIVITIAASTGANAYSRFRVPIVPIEVLLSGYGLRALVSARTQIHSRQL